MNELSPDRAIPFDTRKQIAASLANFYAELSDLKPAEASGQFSLARLLDACANRRPLGSREQEIVEGAALVMGQSYNPHRLWVPLRAVRALGTTPGAKGGYLSGVSVAEPVDILRPWSVVARSGVTAMTGLQDSVVIPRTTIASTAQWIGENPTSVSETPPSLGAATLVPRTAIATIRFSMQLLRQGEAVESFLRAQLLDAVGELLDQAFFSGAGGAAPLGLTGTAGVGSQSGSSLAHAGVLAMRRQVLAAGGQEDRLTWIGTPAVQEVLGGRERAAGGGRFLWDDGGVLGRAAFATKSAPASTLIVGDFSRAVVGIFGPGIRLDVDPSQDFGSAGLVARVLLMCDLAIPQPGAFCVASSVS